MARELELSNEGIALVDDDLHGWLNQWVWTWHERTGVHRKEPTGALAGPRERTVYLHRLVLGARPGQRVQHRNGDRRDNRRANLRFVTHSERLPFRS
jgi:hypothetical protein